MKIAGNTLIFSTGKEVYAYGGVIGLTPDLIPKGGFDDNFPHLSGDDEDMFFEPSDKDMAHEECVELAEYMIDQWSKFMDKHSRR